MEDLEAFARLVTALRPWLGQLVVVGGWAHRLHRFHHLAKPPGHLPLRTRDADLAFSPDEALAGDVRTALTDAGFTEEFLGDDSPPATHYRLGVERLTGSLRNEGYAVAITGTVLSELAATKDQEQFPLRAQYLRALPYPAPAEDGKGLIYYCSFDGQQRPVGVSLRGLQ